MPGASSALGLRPWERSAEAAAEFASFTWPLTSVSEVVRLLACQHIAPTWLLLGEFTGSWAERVERDRGLTTLAVDRRRPLTRCLAYRGEFHDILPLCRWDFVCGFPSCTHSAVSNRHLLRPKTLDHRMFWGLAGVLYCLFAGQAGGRMVEQPDTTLPRYFPWGSSRRTGTGRFGDVVTKTICLYFVGAAVPGLDTHAQPPSQPLAARQPHWAFESAEARDEYRSSWAQFPLFMLALSACLALLVDESSPPSYDDAVETLAVAFHAAGHGVPADYFAADGQSPDPGTRTYQMVRGAGDGRRPPCVVPRSLLHLEPVSAAEPIVVPPSDVHPLHLTALTEAQMVTVASLTARGFMLFFMTTLAQPLVFAHLQGLTVLGAEIPLPLSPKATAVHIVERWAALAWGAAAPATTFMLGRYIDGPRIGVTVLPFLPPERDVILTVSARQRASRYGPRMVWMTMAALTGLAIADPAARAFAHVSSFCRPVEHLADALSKGEVDTPVFTFGAMRAASLVSTPRLQLARTPTELLLARDASDAMLLRTAIIDAVGAGNSVLEGWSERIRPPEIDLHDELAAGLPNFADPSLLSWPFTKVYKPLATSPLPRAPRQPARPTPSCITSPMQLMREGTQQLLRSWLSKALDQLVCIERLESNCELLRPHPLAIGQSGLFLWARGVVWDFTFERDPCAVPLDFTLPIETRLKVKPGEFLHDRLQGYTDERLLSHLFEGVRFEADVELLTVLVPHLVSLPKGFTSVREELYRLEATPDKWYRFFGHIPFWPIYFNGQGAQSRKLEERYRRTTECGGPRKPCFDSTGLRALSLNEASLIHHLPQWYVDRRDEPAMHAWLDAKGLLDPAIIDTPSPLPHQDMPTLAHVMRDISVLLAASRLLDEPIYIFGDDAKDYFNQLAIASEDWWKLGVVFLHAQTALTAQDLPRPPEARLFFISERRLGFGARPSSNIAQRFSEALLFILRQDMDAEELALPVDSRPSAAEWRRVRGNVKLPRAGDPQSSQLRLWSIHMYCDDPIFIVVGVERTLRMLRLWRALTLNAGLLMAIAEKRNLGTWAPWLGVLLCAGLGLVIVPKAKLLRTASRILDVLQQRTEFSEYRSLMGMLEHLLCVNCAPRSVMYGLYQPHRCKRIQLDGPSAIVLVTAFIAEQLSRWLELLQRSGGAPVTAALHPASARVAGALTYVVSSDAATDSHPPGMGGYCHGLYWYLAIPAEWLVWLHITVLEMLATCGSAMAFRAYLSSASHVLLQADGLATPYVLSRHTAKSAMLEMVHHLQLRDRDYMEVAAKADIVHLNGDANVFSDAVSRALWARFFALCRAVNVRPMRVATPPALPRLIAQLVDVARQRGVPVRTSTYTRADPVIPPALLALGRESTACEEADAVAISAALLARLSGAPTPRATQLAAMLPPTALSTTISTSLHSRLADMPPQSETASTAAPTDVTRLAVSSKLAARLGAALNARPGVAKPPRVVRPPQLTAPKREGFTRLQAETIAGMRVLAMPSGVLRPSALREAAHRCASSRADSFVQAGFASHHGVEQLTRLLQHAADLNDYGSSHGTRLKDETAWTHWVCFAEVLGFNPILSPEQVRDHPSHVGTLLATFLLFIYPKMKGRGRQWAKPRSAFAYVLAIIRIFRGWKLILPPAKVVKGELHGLLRAYVNVYGVNALMPGRREPMTVSMLRTMQKVSRIRLGTRFYDPHSPLGVAFRGMLAVGFRTGHRLAEFVAHPSGEVCYLTRGSISYIISGVPCADPSAPQLRAMRPGDVILVAPPRSKTDQFGEIHCPFPSAIPFSTDVNSAGFIIHEIELTRPCRGAARESTPLFADDRGQPFTHAVMDRLLDQMLIHCFGAGAARCYSWHSLRIGLATALKAAKCSDDVIQMICRWTNPDSLRAYARHGQSLHINWVDQAEKAIIDTVQSANVPRVCSTEGNSALHIAYGGAISARAQAVLDAADDAEVAVGCAADDVPDSSPLDAAACVGRRVLIPQAIWPDYACAEHDGRGWAALIIKHSRGAVHLRFQHATTDRGVPYQDVILQLSAVQPI